jgi:ComF family protein
MLNPLRLIRVAGRHTGPLRQGIHSLKYEKRSELAPLLARYLVATFGQIPWVAIQAELDGVVPVPLHRERKAERGYNQSALLAAAFCHQVQLPLCEPWIERVRVTRSQVGLNADQRQINVDKAFQAHPLVENKTLLLVDDVYTTGATLRACAAAALTAGAKAVYGLVLAAPVYTDLLPV